jgi:alkanesulfonate monooxygenase SsuD/methylene tetrahydromethanopterin reductase-like flavin-dependent oxidoreductase (luciferase family)
MDEILEFLPRAWSGKVFSHQGPPYQFPEFAVRPTPDRKIPVVIGGTAEPAIRRAGRRTDGIFSNATPDGFTNQVA